MRRLLVVVIYKDRFVLDLVDKVVLFNIFFSIVYVLNVILFGDFNDDVVYLNFCMKIFIIQEEVEDILFRLNVYKVLGVDGIFVCILKIYVKELLWFLIYLFNLLFILGEVFLIWKRVNIILVFKVNVKENVENYRLIFLLFILGKCQERIVYWVVYFYVLFFFNGWQYGFVKGCFCIIQLVFIYYMWYKVFDDGFQVDVVFLDFIKVFD